MVNSLRKGRSFLPSTRTKIRYVFRADELALVCRSDDNVRCCSQMWPGIDAQRKQQQEQCNCSRDRVDDCGDTCDE